MTTKDNVTPKQSWEFDEEVTDAFDDMLSRSIPSYIAMRKSVDALTDKFYYEGSSIVDLGASRGEASNAASIGGKNVVLSEISKPMIDVLLSKYSSLANVTILKEDLRVTRASLDTSSPTVVLSILTLQFIPINYRQSIIYDIYSSLREGGAFIFVEKVLGGTAVIDKVLTQCYHDMKHAHGYSFTDIERKKLSLEGVLVPVTQKWNEQMLESAGFKHIDCFYRDLNFSGLIAVK